MQIGYEWYQSIWEEIFDKEKISAILKSPRPMLVFNAPTQEGHFSKTTNYHDPDSHVATASNKGCHYIVTPLGGSSEYFYSFHGPEAKGHVWRESYDVAGNITDQCGCWLCRNAAQLLKWWLNFDSNACVKKSSSPTIETIKTL